MSEDELLLATEITSTVERTSDGFKTGKTKNLEYRLYQLRRLCTFLTEQQDGLLEALKADFKSHYEALGEICSLRSEVIKAIDNLYTWTKSTFPPTGLVFKSDSCFMRYEPLGTVLIIAPWNYPVHLLLEPLIGAISAGCSAVVKPSEISPHTAIFLGKNLMNYLDTSCYAIINGGAREAGILLDWPHWNLIFFTGSRKVGRLIQQKAAINLIPTVLELGGKSPCIVTESAKLENTAKRIVFGKLFNAGQTCVSPDYILTLPELVPRLKESLISAIKSFYGDDPSSSSTGYSRIPNHQHWDRLDRLLEGCKNVIQVGRSNRETKHFAPTLIIDPDPSCPLMQEEIFGPILPILTVPSLDAAIKFINARGEPLALYIFSQSNDEVEQVLNGTISGGCAVNDTLLQVFSGIFPLGGVGASGMGRYKGRWSFETFSHHKPVMWRSINGEVLNDFTRNPPITDRKFYFFSLALFSTPKPHHLAPPFLDP